MMIAQAVTCYDFLVIVMIYLRITAACQRSDPSSQVKSTISREQLERDHGDSWQDRSCGRMSHLNH